MPPRPIVWIIVTFWLAATGWLFYRELLPWLSPGEAPPFTIDLAAEAQRASASSTWLIIRGQRQIGRVHIGIEYHDADDSFELQSQIKQLDLGEIGPLVIAGEELSSSYRVTRSGQLLGMDSQGLLHVRGTGIASFFRVDFEMKLGGKVDGARFKPYGQIVMAGQKYDLDLEEVAFARQASVLNPLHPVNRIAGLRRGQRWQIHLVDPLADALTAMIKKNPALEVLLQKNQTARILQAEVLPELESLIYENQETPCLVIEYRSENLTAHTWVRASDGKVLKQEAILWGERLVLERI